MISPCSRRAFEAGVRIGRKKCRQEINLVKADLEQLKKDTSLLMSNYPHVSDVIKIDRLENILYRKLKLKRKLARVSNVNIFQ
jgi:hypothetical protein